MFKFTFHPISLFLCHCFCFFFFFNLFIYLLYIIIIIIVGFYLVCLGFKHLYIAVLFVLLIGYYQFHYISVCVCVCVLMMAGTMTKQSHNGQCKQTKIYIVEGGCHNDRYATECFYKKCATCVYGTDVTYSSMFMKIYMYHFCFIASMKLYICCIRFLL